MKGKKTENKVVKTNNSKNEKRKLIMGIAMMVFAVAVAAGTYAYYQSTISGTVSGTILAWDCTNNTGTSGNINLGNLKPGSQGNFALKVKSTNFKTDLTVTLKYSNSNVPANFKLYKDSGYATSIAMNGTSAVTAFTENGQAANSEKTFTVYYKWPIGTTAETPIATGTTNKTFAIVYTITCKQSSSQ